MADQQPEKGNNSGSESPSELAAWLEASDNFYLSYYKIIALTSQIAPQQDYIGQCPVNQLLSASQTMQVELEKLLFDFDQGELPHSHDGYNYLVHHSALLNQLTDQIQRLLQLASLPGSTRLD
jgi:hypothetical protein